MTGSGAHEVSDVTQKENPNEVVRKLVTAMRKFLDDLEASDSATAPDHDVEPRSRASEIEDNAAPVSEVIEITAGSNEDTRPEPVSTEKGKSHKPDYWISPDALERCKKKFNEHERECNAMCEELEHLGTHYRLVGGDKSVIITSDNLRDKLEFLLDSIRLFEKYTPGERMFGIIHTSGLFSDLSAAVNAFHDSLYHQKHAFYFRSVRRWKECLENGLSGIGDNTIWRDNLEECFEYIHVTLFHELEVAMKAVREELKTFGEKLLPTLLADEKERATTRYVNITTIATFFSSVTATTLQMSLMYPGSTLYGIVNFFWFLSLVFSVSSGVSSLLGMTWRKSSIYDTDTPPRLIRLWLDKVPMIFLIIAAFSFIIGLNLFACLSSQLRYVSLTTNVFTGVHSLCLLAVSAWFIYRLKHDSAWAQWVDFLIKWIFSPRKALKENLHLQRNIYWAFGLDKRVLTLNYEIGRAHDYPAPYMLAQIFRFIAHPLKKVAVATMTAVKSSFRRVMRNCSGRTLDEESQDVTENALDSQEASCHVKDSLPSERPEVKAMDRYRRSLEGSFGILDLNDNIMKCIAHWTNGNWTHDDIKDILGRRLWGYPNLVAEFENELLPVLTVARMQNLEVKREQMKRNRKNPDAAQDVPTEVAGPEEIIQDIGAATDSRIRNVKSQSLDSPPSPETGETTIARVTHRQHMGSQDASH